MPSLDQLTARQSRAARSLLGLSQEALAVRAKVGPKTVMGFESGLRQPIPATRQAIALALQNEGVVLLENEGVAFAR